MIASRQERERASYGGQAGLYRIIRRARKEEKVSEGLKKERGGHAIVNDGGMDG